jgi:hypothetical protein
LKLQEIGTLEQADMLVQLLEAGGRVAEASQLKDKIIAELVDLLNASNYAGDIGKHTLQNAAWLRTRP